jgi:hypothetical protein
LRIGNELGIVTDATRCVTVEIGTGQIRGVCPWLLRNYNSAIAPSVRPGVTGGTRRPAVRLTQKFSSRSPHPGLATTRRTRRRQCARGARCGGSACSSHSPRISRTGSGAARRRRNAAYPPSGGERWSRAGGQSAGFVRRSGSRSIPRRGSWPEGERKRRRFRGRAPLDRAVAAAAAAQGAREPAPRAAPPARSTYCPEQLLPGTLSAQTTAGPEQHCRVAVTSSGRWRGWGATPAARPSF